MELVVLGSGTLLAQKDRSCAAYLLRHENGLALIDCGPGCLLRLHQAGAAVTDISLVLISHFHWDHVAELPALLNSLWLQRGKTAAGLTLAGPSGLSAWMDRVMAEDRDWLADLGLRLCELNAKPVGIGALRVRAGRSFHTENSLSFRLQNPCGNTLFYSGDMDYHASLIELAAEADMAVVECSWPQGRREKGHLDPRLASRFAAEARVRMLLLTHFYQEVFGGAVIDEVKKRYTGPVLLAEDLQVHSIP
jgi:ribonuclease BN (tRNA processing enzyme)